MQRRRSLELLSGFGSALILPTTLTINENNASAWLPFFSTRWEIGKTYTYEIFEAMPDSMLQFQPNSEMMSFGKLFTHIGWGLEIYTGTLDGSTPREEPKTTRTEILNYLEHCFDHFDLAFKALKETELYSNNHRFLKDEPWKDFSIADMLLLAYNHTIHHRAQATVYLRLKEIVPPKYRF
ncbi:MAG: DinB family protein [Saprospiraceae bacterium]|nr:DinB family protein [Saprospiraceae bacterium]